MPTISNDQAEQIAAEVYARSTVDSVEAAFHLDWEMVRAGAAHADKQWLQAIGWDAPPKPAKVGPTITIKKSCSACSCERSESYTAQGDSGMHVYCHHDAVGKRLIGNDTWVTPDWCPAEDPCEQLLASAGLCTRCAANLLHNAADEPRPGVGSIEQLG